MTTKERQHLEHIKIRLKQATAFLTGQDKSWGMALERMTDAADEVDAMLDAKPRKSNPPQPETL